MDNTYCWVAKKCGLQMNQSLDHDGFKLKGWLHEVMRLKLEYLVSRYHHRIEFVRPGTMFDRRWMTEIPDEEGSALIPDTQYRVRLCVSPALVGRIDDTKWSQGPVSTLTSVKSTSLLFWNPETSSPKTPFRKRLRSETGLSAEP
ncbi:unnamed protein product [Alternaria burnsii]|nr:unnamed protein product [Alternaria burnsii]